MAEGWTRDGRYLGFGGGEKEKEKGKTRVLEEGRTWKRESKGIGRGEGRESLEAIKLWDSRKKSKAKSVRSEGSEEVKSCKDYG